MGNQNNQRTGKISEQQHLQRIGPTCKCSSEISNWAVMDSWKGKQVLPFQEGIQIAPFTAANCLIGMVVPEYRISTTIKKLCVVCMV